MPLYGYARVSTLDQDLGIQRAALKAAGCGVVRAEKASGSRRDGRTELQVLLDFVQPGDTLVVTRIDRLARSMRDLQDIVHELKERGVALRATEQPVDTGTAVGKAFLDLPNGVPSHDTFRRVFMLIDPDAFEAGFTAWVGSLADRFEREVVAIDGKTVRRSFDRGREQSALHVVSAWASEQGLVLGQRCVDGKSNEITAVPELLDQLALENSIVTLDAMGCQTAIAEKILARGGDYLLTLKGNHKLAHAAVVEHFDQRCFRVGAPHRADCDAFDDTHGRLVRRRVFASTDAAALEALSGWPGLRTVLAVESIRSVNSAPTKVESEIRYFLSSCPDDPAVLGKAIRSHWAVENALHWVVDVTFREDDSRVRDRTAARNLALLCKIALNIVGRDKTTKASVRTRRKKAAWNDAYMLKLLAG